jgi:large subunit ribosomal protein L9
MEVILLQDVESLGKQGDLIKVKDGYARNFLFPRKMAALSTPESLKMIEQTKKKKAKEDEKMKAEAEEIAKKINALSCTISVEAGVEDKIFGTVTPEMIKNMLRQENITVDKKDVIIEEPIKKLGVYQIKIKLMHGVEATLRVWVVKK